MPANDHGKRIKAGSSPQGRTGHDADLPERRGKWEHARLLTFLTWIFLIHAAGIYFFTRGFLLTRLVLDHHSECHVSPRPDAVHGREHDARTGCWHPKTFDKAVILIVDALRYDFTVPSSVAADRHERRPHYRDAIPVLYQTAVDQPHQAFLVPFIADPPTTTLQRLKGLTTGTLPTFIDAGSNFAGTAIDEDNLVAQLRGAGRRVVHLGDDTWQALFPAAFEANLSRPYDSLNVWDLHTVDNGVTEHLLPLLHPSNTSRWDVVVGHFLGVDHAGHRYGPDHAAMAAKLRQMDGVLRQTIAALDPSTLLVVMGDHGMDVKGDHGGESDDEVQAALWMFSKKAVFGRSSAARMLPPATARERAVWQIDLVPTLALLLGLPIPFNNLGAPIEEAFIGRDGDDWRNVATVNRLTAAQIKRYQHEYRRTRGMPNDTLSRPALLWDYAERTWDDVRRASPGPPARPWREAAMAFRAYEAANLSVCKELWARFDVPSMIEGILVLLAGLFLITAYVSGHSDVLGRMTGTAWAGGVVQGAVAGSLIAGGVGGVEGSSSRVPVGAVLGGIAGDVMGRAVDLGRRIAAAPWLTARPSPWTWLALLFTISQSIGFASNSYTIWEDEILLFFISTFGVLALVHSLRQRRATGRYSDVYQPLVFQLLTRLASLSRLCREEQMPRCRSTYYASSSSSTSALWQVLLPFVLAFVIPAVVTRYAGGSGEGAVAPRWVMRAGLSLGMLLTAVFWTMDAADDAGWWAARPGLLKTLRMGLARGILGVALVAGPVAFVWAMARAGTKPGSGTYNTNGETMSLSSSGEEGASSSPSATATAAAAATANDNANAHGTRYLLLPLTIFVALLLLQKPMGQVSLCILLVQILSLLEILSTPASSSSSSPLGHQSRLIIGPVMLGQLGQYHFFKTGHQATLSSIQWEAAFIPLAAIRYPWSALLVLANTFAAQILCALALPLLVLWRRPRRRRRRRRRPAPGQERELGRAMLAYVAYQAVLQLATTLCAAWLRRHLMLYRIFSPRWIFASAALLVADLVVLVAVAVAVAVEDRRWRWRWL
ncbi:MAG: mannose-ethanolamine phosphotransferase gpi13 [Phylliscum demangeonii]|nr:MAG: mannose-ethanolamine phosphotransferase gpi13 [Phylliscum demangeonii]